MTPILGIMASQISGHLSVNYGTAGYSLGGSIGPSSAIVKLLYSTEASSTLSPTLTSARYQGAGTMSNPKTAIYCLGGMVTYPTRTDTIDKITITDTKSALSATLNEHLCSLGSVSFGTTAGYIAGGDSGDTGAPPVRNAIAKLAYSTETRTQLSVTLSSTFVQPSQNVFSSTNGYFVGGYDQGVAAPSAAIQKFVFSGETISTISATLNVANYAAGGFSNGDTAGYIVTGSITPTADINKLTFSTDTRSVLSATLADANYGAGACTNGTTAGYIFGGYTGTYKTYIQKLLYSTETRTTISAVLPTGNQTVAASM